MQIKTVLNRVQKFKSFVYGAVRWNEATSPPSLDVEAAAAGERSATTPAEA